MPIYEYQCPGCQHHQEEIMNRLDTTEVLCSLCQASMTRVPSVAFPKFTGYGFYATDYPKHYCKRDKDEELKRLGKLPAGDA
jgi:putative FmdB family regulatory protein